MAESLFGPGAGHFACSLRGLASHAHAPSLTARGLIEWVSAQGCRAIVLDAIHPEMRPRDLGRSARRDLAASIRRAELEWKGIDVFVPAAHLVSVEHSDRALAAVLGAIDLAGELRTMGIGDEPVVTLDLPDEPVEGVERTIADAAERAGVIAACVSDAHPALKRAIDLDAMHEAGADVVGALTSYRTVQVRWGGPKAERRVDLISVTGALAIRTEPCAAVLDLSRSAEPAHTVSRALDAWARANPDRLM